MGLTLAALRSSPLTLRPRTSGFNPRCLCHKKGPRAGSLFCGGDGGIRTHDRVTPIHTFQACAIDHSATSPHPFREGTPLAARLRFRKGKGFAIPARMNKYLTLAASAAIFAGVPLSAQKPAAEAKTYPAPSEIVAAAKAEEWLAIAPSDLLVMDLAPDAKGKPRRVVIQLMPAPFSVGWVGNIRKMAAAKFWDGTSINRVQDNYVVQWGDATEKKVLPDGLAVVPENDYPTKISKILPSDKGYVVGPSDDLSKALLAEMESAARAPKMIDPYSESPVHFSGWPLAGDFENYWPTHCYGMVGVGRNLSPDTGPARNSIPLSAMRRATWTAI